MIKGETVHVLPFFVGAKVSDFENALKNWIRFVKNIAIIKLFAFNYRLMALDKSWNSGW